jgi:hypothetical protein
VDAIATGHLIQIRTVLRLPYQIFWRHVRQRDRAGIERKTMSVSSVALSSLMTSPSPPPQNAVSQSVSAKGGTAAPPPVNEEEPLQKAALPPKVGQIIDISA